jgi:hydroxypyruvate isomerase
MVVGGGIGAIADAASGANYKYPTTINVTLAAQGAQLHLLTRYLEDFEWGEWSKALVGKIITGVATLGRVKGADDDERIITLFREWCAAWRASAAKFQTDDELDATVDAANRHAAQIYDAPVRGVVGSRSKHSWSAISTTTGLRSALMTIARRVHSTRITIPPADCAGRKDGPRLPTSTCHCAVRGLLASAASFVPELWSLVAEAVESP